MSFSLAERRFSSLFDARDVDRLEDLPTNSSPLTGWGSTQEWYPFIFGQKIPLFSATWLMTWLFLGRFCDVLGWWGK